MTGKILHYIHDPLCGWCYAVAPLIEAAEAAGVVIAFNGGGLWPAPARLPSERVDYIRESDTRIASRAGVEFGDAYFDLLASPETVFWSRPTIAAILAAGAIREGTEVRMLHAIQHAHYVAGRRVVEAAVLADVAGSLGIDRSAFSQALDVVPVDRHIAETRSYMARLASGGFPTFVLERGSGAVRVGHEAFHGRPDAFVATLEAARAQSAIP